MHTATQPSPLHRPSLANPGKLQVGNVWKCALCAIKSRTFNHLGIKNGFCEEEFPKGICCIHFAHHFEDRNIITVTSPS